MFNNAKQTKESNKIYINTNRHYTGLVIFHMLSTKNGKCCFLCSVTYPLLNRERRNGHVGFSICQISMIDLKIIGKLKELL